MHKFSHRFGIVFTLNLLIIAGCGGIGLTSAAAASRSCGRLPRATARAFNARLTAFVRNLCYEKQHWQHDANVRTSDGVHTYVKVWYSPSLFKWMTTDNRQGPVPDGAVVIKEEHETLTSPLLLWSVMIKDSDLSWDGWYWGAVFPKSANTQVAARDVGAGCAEPQPLLAGAGLYCLNCHASAIGGSGTFSSTEYLNPSSTPAAAFGVSNPLFPAIFDRSLFGPAIALGAHADAIAGFTGRVPSAVFGNLRPLPRVPCMPGEQLDHVVAQSAAKGGVQEFVTSDQCSGCHDATGTLFGSTPNMIYGAQSPAPVNLSPYGEWRYSMMALSGRDPIFFAQLDTESTLHRRIAGKKNGAAFVQDLCFRCHGVMGQRQYHLDHAGKPGALFTLAKMRKRNSPYGALARDGVSCAVCHHMSDDKLQDPSTYTGLFHVGPADVMYGPYPSDTDPSGAKTGDSVIPLPMQIALGITPVAGPQMQQANLCASCHTIVLPVYDAKGRPVMENGSPKTDFEQTTFLEWLNSGFVTVPCQTCHMPDSYNGTQLQFKIANIEDNTFPPVPETGPSTRLPDADLELQQRIPYRRHTLLGINVFALEMFDQYRTDLGLFKVDPNLPGPLAQQISGLKTAVQQSVLQAETKTATVSIGSLSASGGVLQADVEVDNLAGHNLPTGVSFRRAFLNFQVLDAQGNVLWASGNTNSDGVIVDTSGNPLVTEFFGPRQQTFQPHYWTGNPITSDKQVEIYEELYTDPQGMLTTSFLSLDHKVKDNRIQAQGRSFNGPGAAVTAPVGTGDDPSYMRGCGCSVVRYQVPMTGAVANAAAVRATLYYQSIPPYYLRQRAEDARGPDTARLIDFVSGLAIGNYPAIKDWKLELATTGVVNIP